MPPPEPASALFHIAFYRFVRLHQPERVAAVLRELTQELLGVVLVASEGINGTLAGSATALDRFEAALRDDTRLAGCFAGMAFRRTACRTPPFQRIKVHHRPEILPLGVAGIDAVGHAGTRVGPREWDALIAQPDVVLIDNRNRFEVRLGRFRGAVDPGVDNFRDFPRYIEAHAPQWKAAGQRVAMYCTGGIRCEKTAAWMAGMGVEVLQLDGGILNYLAQTHAATPTSTTPTPPATSGAADAPWQGECFVFDNRIALDARLQETATRAEDVYAGAPDEQWRLQRARRLASAVAPAGPERDPNE